MRSLRQICRGRGYKSHGVKNFREQAQRDGPGRHTERRHEREQRRQGKKEFCGLFIWGSTFFNLEFMFVTIVFSI